MIKITGHVMLSGYLKFNISSITPPGCPDYIMPDPLDVITDLTDSTPTATSPVSTNLCNKVV